MYTHLIKQVINFISSTTSLLHSVRRLLSNQYLHRHCVKQWPLPKDGEDLIPLKTLPTHMVYHTKTNHWYLPEEFYHFTAIMQFSEILYLVTERRRAHKVGLVRKTILYHPVCTGTRVFVVINKRRCFQSSILKQLYS